MIKQFQVNFVTNDYSNPYVNIMYTLNELKIDLSFNFVLGKNTPLIKDVRKTTFMYNL